MIDIRNALKLLDVVYVNQNESVKSSLISNKLKGRVISDETRINMSESKKQYWAQKKNGT
jgi:hypothetical protein